MMTRVLCALALTGMFAATALGQAMAETATATGAIAGAAVSKGKTLGDAVSGAIAKGAIPGTKPLPDAKQEPAAAPITSKMLILSSATPRRSEPEVRIAKPSRGILEGIKEGTKREELLAKVGRPAFSFSQTTGGELVETMNYWLEEGGSADVQVSGGRVIAVKLPKEQ